MFMGFKRLTRRRRERIRKNADERKALASARRAVVANRRNGFSSDFRLAKTFYRTLDRREIELFLAAPCARGGRANLGALLAAVFPHLYWEPRPARVKLGKLLLASASRAPKLLVKRTLDAFLFLMNDPWLRPLDEWEPRGKSNDAIMRSLVAHLVVKYPIPRFLYSVFLGETPSGRDACARKVYHAAARGGSVHRAFRNATNGPVMTRPMCRLLMSGSGGLSFHEAVRRAQTIACGGSPKLAEAIGATFLAREFRRPERLWLAAVEWLSTRNDVENARLGEIFDYLSHGFEENPDFSFTGRTWAALVRGMEGWHKDLSFRRSIGGGAFARSGFTDGAWIARRTNSKGGLVRLRWSLLEVLNGDDLCEEGREMRHCVAIYAESIASGGCSIWSLRRDGNRALTIEVDNKRRRIVQAKGKCNRRPEDWELRIVERWARENAMKMTL
jgi:hypothetical protein